MSLFKKNILSVEEEALILKAIQQAEAKTSGEIRIHIDKWCKNDPVFKARNLFVHLEMQETAQRNGVLIYVAADDHKFAIIGDEGINNKVPEGFWDSTAAHMKESFARGNLADGICKGIAEAGEQLSIYFPVLPGDKNELTDDISYG